ncbi:MAG: transglycosylase SLT domain-containing protein [Betaproteobacteria bacterium]
MRAHEMLRQAWRATLRSTAVFAGDVGRGLLAVSHNTLAVVGLLALVVLAFGAGRPDLRHQFEQSALRWLQDRHEARELASGNILANLEEPGAVARATAMDPKALAREQQALTQWIARRYKVAPEPVGALVREAWALGERARLDPTLILAIVAIESSFNPFAQSPMGAQGLMQVMTRVHDEKFEPFGGTHATFDPITNLRVGVQVLRECIARAGSVAEGLRAYVGAALLDGDGGYAARVLAEQAHMRNVAEGRPVPVNAATTPAPGARDAVAGPLDAAPAAQPRPTAAPASVPAGRVERVALVR